MIFFDIDNTLTDFSSAEQSALNALYSRFKNTITIDQKKFRKYSRTASKNTYRRYITGQLSFEKQQTSAIKELFLLSGFNLSDEKTEQISELYTKIFNENMFLFNDVITCLKKFAKHNLGLISNGSEKQQTDKLKRAGILHYFSLIITSGALGIAKPDKRIFIYACEKAEKPPQQCWYIGNNFNTDITPAVNIGMNCLWIDRRRTHIKNNLWIDSLDKASEIINKTEREI